MDEIKYDNKDSKKGGASLIHDRSNGFILLTIEACTSGVFRVKHLFTWSINTN